MLSSQVPFCCNFLYDCFFCRSSSSITTSSIVQPNSSYFLAEFWLNYAYLFLGLENTIAKMKMESLLMRMKVNHSMKERPSIPCKQRISPNVLKSSYSNRKGVASILKDANFKIQEALAFSVQCYFRMC